MNDRTDSVTAGARPCQDLFDVSAIRESDRRPGCVNGQLSGQVASDLQLVVQQKLLQIVDVLEAAGGVVTRQDPEIAQQVPAGSGHRGAQAYQEIIGLEQDGSGAVLPNLLQRQLQPAIGAQLESVLGQRWAGDVAGESFELLSIPTVDELRTSLGRLSGLFRAPDSLPAPE